MGKNKSETSYGNFLLVKKLYFLWKVTPYPLTDFDLNLPSNKFFLAKNIFEFFKSLNPHNSKPEVEIDTAQKPFLSARQYLNYW